MFFRNLVGREFCTPDLEINSLRTFHLASHTLINNLSRGFNSKKNHLRIFLISHRHFFNFKIEFVLIILEFSSSYGSFVYRLNNSFTQNNKFN